MRRFDLNHSPQMRHKRLTKDVARRMAVSFAKLPELSTTYCEGSPLPL